MDRILEHMNADHKLSLYDYLGYYGKIELSPLDSKTSVEMTFIDVNKFTLKYHDRNGKTGTKDIAIEPPMNSLREARERLVEMATKSSSARGFSLTQVKRYIGPSRLDEYAVLSLVVILAVSAVAPRVTDGLPFVGRLLRQHGRNGAIFTALVHLGEYLIFFRPLLRKYRVPSPTRFWWTLSMLWEGFPAILRLKAAGEKH